jgi:dihydrofolate reductase
MPASIAQYKHCWRSFDLYRYVFAYCPWILSIANVITAAKEERMRMLKIQVQASIDGYMAGANDDMSWMTWDWDTELMDYVNEINGSISTILLGRNLAEGFIDHWGKIYRDKENPEYESGKLFYETEKFVFSKSLTASRWENTRVVNSDAIQFIDHLKSTEGKDIIAYGGAQFINSLLASHAVDEFHLFINPAALGAGKRIFPITSRFTITSARLFACGIVGVRMKELPA